MISDLIRTGGGRLVAVSSVHRGGALVAPCGRCRQLLFEHGGSDLVLDWDPEPIVMRDLLPHAFGPDDLR